MRRRIVSGFLGLLAVVFLSSCGKEDKPVHVAVNVNAASEANAQAQPKLSPQEIYDAAIASAFQLLNEKKDDEALVKFGEEANAAGV